jgi:hypothetical protein
VRLACEPSAWHTTAQAEGGAAASAGSASMMFAPGANFWSSAYMTNWPFACATAFAARW